MVSKFGKGALMEKFDVEAAYRNIAVHPTDRYLLGMKWRGQYYVDVVVCFFGLFFLNQFFKLG